MAPYKTLLSLYIFAFAIASASPTAKLHSAVANLGTRSESHGHPGGVGSTVNQTYGCGEVNIILTGLPPYHPLVIAQGYDPVGTDKALRADLASSVQGGYNVRMVLVAPEQSLDILANRMEGTFWHGSMVGMGLRGSQIEELTPRFEDVLQLYRQLTPRAYFAFNHRPDSTLWAIQRRWPLSENCTNSPGKDLGYEIYCDICTNSNTTNSTGGA